MKNFLSIFEYIKMAYMKNRKVKYGKKDYKNFNNDQKFGKLS